MEFSVVGGWHCSFVTANDVTAARENLRMVSRRRHVSLPVCQCEEKKMSLTSPGSSARSQSATEKKTFGAFLEEALTGSQPPPSSYNKGYT